PGGMRDRHRPRRSGVVLLDTPALRRDGTVHERADAARNRQRVLEAARRLFAERDPATVTMGDIAEAAGVGRATVYRRFPNTAAVAGAPLGEHERRPQQAMGGGPAPRRPGGPP